MALPKKEIFYWASCVFYGVALTLVLLYVRFPAEKFRRYCERLVEHTFGEVTCSIEKIEYVFPQQLNFKSVRIEGKNGEQQAYFSDPLFSVEPVWSNPLHLFAVKSTAFNGSHSGRVQIDNEKNTLDLSKIKIRGVSLDQVSLLNEKLDRKVGGTFEFTGDIKLRTEQFKFIKIEGVASVYEGQFALKKPILELTTLDLTKSSVHVTLQDDKVELSKGEMKGKKLTASFEGSINFSQSWTGSPVLIKGEIAPLPPLFLKKRQLKAIVTRMQRRYKTQALPYHVNGTVGRPTFAFGN